MTKLINEKKYQLQNSFTLLEIILYIFIFSVLGIALYQFSNISMRTNAYSQSVAEVELQGSALMLKIVSAINNAPASGGINYPTQGLSSSSLSVGSIESLIDPVIFFLDGTSLSTKEGKNPSEILSSNRIKVSNLKFTNLGKNMTDGVIQIKFTLGINGSGLKDFNFSRDFVSAANPLLKYCSEIPCSMNSCSGTDCGTPYPGTQAYGLKVSSVRADGFTAGGSRGNGQGVVYFVNEGSTVAFPLDGIAYDCLATTTYSDATTIPSGGAKCLNKITNPTISFFVDGLTKLTSYSLAAYEYNVVDGIYYYNKLTNTDNPITIRTPLR